MLDYNVPLGKLNRGMAVLDVVRSMAKSDDTSQEEQARILGWCIEFVSTVYKDTIFVPLLIPEFLSISEKSTIDFFIQ